MTHSVSREEESEQADIVHFVNLVTEQQAKELYNEAKARLLDVSHWNMWSSGINTRFILVDENGRKVLRPARMGDHFMINVPERASPSGEGNNWIRIETIEEERSPEEQRESFSMRMSAVINPGNGESNTAAYLLRGNKTNTLRLYRSGRKVTVRVDRENETPDTGAGNIPGLHTSSGFIFRFPRHQWQKLTRGLLEYKGL